MTKLLVIVLPALAIYALTAGRWGHGVAFTLAFAAVVVGGMLARRI